MLLPGSIMRFTSIALFLSVTATLVQGFSVSILQGSRRLSSSTSRWDAPSADRDEMETTTTQSNPLQSLEDARHEFEQAWRQSTQPSSIGCTSPNFPVMTSIARQRMELEIQLLQQLLPTEAEKEEQRHVIPMSDHKDDYYVFADREAPNNDNDRKAIDALEELWMTEGGGARIRQDFIGQSSTKKEEDDDGQYVPDVTMYVNMIQQMERGGVSSGLRQEEQILHHLCQANPEQWADVHVRYALLLYYQGRTVESYHAALDALAIKPWHFEAYQVLVQLSLRHPLFRSESYAQNRADNDDDDTDHVDRQCFASALRYARRGMPRNRYSHRRKEWVEWATEKAKQQFHQMEQATQDYYDTCDLSTVEDNEQPKDGSDNENVWQ
jgi:hypothetical protein